MEGLAIVASILFAFGIDAWWDGRADRIAEREYLERLLDDSRFDRAENELVVRVSRDVMESSERLIELIEKDSLRSLEAEQLIPLFLRASDYQKPDYSRSTYEELVNSGRIGLIEVPAVRRSLADYDRDIRQVSGVWQDCCGNGNPFHVMRIRTVPANIHTRWAVSCRGRAPEECSMDHSAETMAAILVALRAPDVIGDIRQAMSVQATTRLVVESFLEPAAADLEGALRDALTR